jgi:hypothetical protein
LSVHVPGSDEESQLPFRKVPVQLLGAEHRTGVNVIKLFTAVSYAFS